MIKNVNRGVLFALAFLSFSQVAKADSPLGTVQDFSQSVPANGTVMEYDLDGDGKNEKISLTTNWKANDGRSSSYRLKVNNVYLDDIWPETDLAGNVKVEGFMLGDLNTRDRSKEIVVGGPSQDDTAFRIYAWRSGKIRRVLREPMFIRRFNGDGSITEQRYLGWAEVHLPYRLNGQGELKLVPRTSYLLMVYGSAEKRKPTKVLKNVFFRLQPNNNSLAFEVPRGSTVIFDRTNNKGWAGAMFNGRLGWISEAWVNGDSETFDLTKAG